MPDPDPFAAYRRAPVVAAQESADPFAAYRRRNNTDLLPTRPVSAEDFMRPADIANRDNGTSIVGDILKGAAKGLGRSVMGMGEMASTGIAERAARAAAQAAGAITGRPSPFNPVIRDPTLVRVDEALTPANQAEKVGGYMETAAELAPGAIGLAKSAPAIARAAADSIPVAVKVGGPAIFDVATGHPVRAARRILGAVLDNSGKVAAKVAEAAPAAVVEPPIYTGTAATTPETIAAPGGFSMPVRVPAKPVAAPPGRVVAGAPRLSAEEQLAASMAKLRQPEPVTVTTPPPAELPPGYTPRTTVPKPRAARPAAPEPAAEAPPTTQPARRAYFLRSPEEMAAASAPAEAVTPSGSIAFDDLPTDWKLHTGQDIFPLTGVEAKEVTAALRAEIKERGMTLGQAMARVSRNPHITTEQRYQIQRALSGGSQ